MNLKIGTRMSRLAMAQTFLVKDAIRSVYPEAEAEIIKFTTHGDKVIDKPLNEMGGKGVFVGEIEKALRQGEIDIAVHSAKDLPAQLADGLEISGVLPRGNYRDMLITRKGNRFCSGDRFKVGTGSLRRRINFSRLYPNAEFADIRGNVDTRLKKLETGEYDGIILCSAGLERLGISLDSYETETYEYNVFLPAPCQGIIAAECVSGSSASEIIHSISDKNSMLCFETEREIVKLLGADCSVPIGTYSEIRGNSIFIQLSDNSVRSASGETEIENRSIFIKELISKL